MSAGLEIRLFGGLSIQQDNTQLNGQFASRKAEALLAYLICNPEPQSRSYLAGLLWDNRTPQRAEGNLRVLISSLHQTVDEHLIITNDSLSIKPGTELWVDVYEFGERLGDIDLRVNLVRDYLHGRGKTALLTPKENQALQDALSLYRGPFIYDLRIRESSGFDNWVSVERSKYRHLAYAAADRVASHALTTGNLHSGIAWVQTMLDLDVLNEEGHRKMMVLRYLNGQRNAAIDQFDAITTLLADELGVPPSPETFTLFEQLRDGNLVIPEPPGKSLRVNPRQASRVPLNQAPVIAQPSTPANVPHNLRKSLTRLIGRNVELRHLAERLYDPERRLVTITGLGGIGKTRLSEEAAWRTYNDAVARAQFQDGIFWVSLSSASSPEFVINEIAVVLDINLAEADSESPKGDTDSHSVLIDALADKHILLILDNFEHLMEAKELVWDLLQHLPHLTMMITSREHLGLRGEWRINLDGLAYDSNFANGRSNDPNRPELEAIPRLKTGTNADTPRREQEGNYSLDGLPAALQLFSDVASRADAGFTISEDNIASIRQICGLLDGMPLGIELAASLVSDASCQEIASGVSVNKDMLATTMWDVPEGQRTLRAVFNHSWTLLSQEQQAILTRLGIFSGGFTLDAAREIADVDTPELELLATKSLIKIGDGGPTLSTSQSQGQNRLDQGAATHAPASPHEEQRYKSHASIHQYIQETLVKETALYEQMQARHSDYYCQKLRHHPHLLASDQALHAATQIVADIRNIRAIWHRSLRKGDWQTVEDLANILAPYYQLKGLNREAEKFFIDAVNAIKSFRSTTGEAGGETDDESAATLLSQANLDLRAVAPSESLRSLSLILIELARCQQNQSKYLESTESLRQAIELAEAIAARDLMAKGHYQWGIVLTRQGDSDLALAQIQQAADLARKIGDIELQGHSFYQMAVIEFRHGTYAGVRKCTDMAVEIYAELQYPRGLANALNLDGIVCSLQGDYEESCAAYEQALKIYREIGDLYGEGFATSNLGRVWAERGNYAKADSFYALADTINEQVDNQYQLSSITLSRGRDAVWRGDFDAAGAYLSTALNHKQDIQDRPGEADSLICTSLLAYQLGDHETALRYANEGLAIAAELNERSLLAHAHMNCGRALEQLERLDDALVSYENAFALREALGQVNLLLEPLAAKAHVEYLQGHQADAYETIGPILSHLADKRLDGLDDPIRLLLICRQICEGVDSSDRRDLLRQARQLMDERAKTILESDKRTYYRERIPSHHALQQLQ